MSDMRKCIERLQEIYKPYPCPTILSKEDYAFYSGRFISEEEYQEYVKIKNNWHFRHLQSGIQTVDEPHSDIDNQ